MLALHSYLGAVASKVLRPLTRKTANRFQMSVRSATAPISKNVISQNPPEDPNYEIPIGSLGAFYRFSDDAMSALVLALMDYSYTAQPSLDPKVQITSYTKGPKLADGTAKTSANSLGILLNDAINLNQLGVYAKITEVDAFLADSNAPISIATAANTQGRLMLRSLAMPEAQIDASGRFAILGRTEFPAVAPTDKIAQFSATDWQIRLCAVMPFLATVPANKDKIDPKDYGQKGSGYITGTWNYDDDSDPTTRAFVSYLNTSGIRPVYDDPSLNSIYANCYAYNILVDATQAQLKDPKITQNLIDFNKKEKPANVTTASAAGGSMLPMTLALVAAAGIAYAVFKPAGDDSSSV